MRTTDAEMNRPNLDTGHELRFLDRPLDRVHGGFEIHDDTALEPLGV
jgi:hypothetical protein